MAADQSKIDELELHLRGLVFVRAILEQRGASQGELDRHAIELAQVRGRLARERRRAWTADDEAA